MSIGDGIQRQQILLSVASHGASDPQRYAAEFSYSCFGTRSLLIIHSYNVYLQKHAVDFYISDFQSGLRALVKAGYGARVIPYVEETIAIEVDPLKKESSPELIQWLGERNLSVSDRLMRLKEG